MNRFTQAGFSLVHPTARDAAGSPVIIDGGDRHYLRGARRNHSGLTRTERIAAGFGTAQDFAERDADSATTTKAGMKRKVKIELIRNTWMVLYVDRRKYQKRSLAQFDATSISADYVREWVNRNPKLELVR